MAFREVKKVKSIAPTIYDEPQVRVYYDCGHKDNWHKDCEIEVEDMARCSTCTRIQWN